MIKQNKRTFGQKSEFLINNIESLSKNQNVGQNGNVGQKSKFRIKIELITKYQYCDQKSKFSWSKS